jgi:hypothetical protein
MSTPSICTKSTKICKGLVARVKKNEEKKSTHALTCIAVSSTLKFASRSSFRRRSRNAEVFEGSSKDCCILHQKRAANAHATVALAHLLLLQTPVRCMIISKPLENVQQLKTAKDETSLFDKRSPNAKVRSGPAPQQRRAGASRCENVSITQKMLQTTLQTSHHSGPPASSTAHTPTAAHPRPISRHQRRRNLRCPPHLEANRRQVQECARCAKHQDRGETVSRGTPFLRLNGPPADANSFKRRQGLGRQRNRMHSCSARQRQFKAHHQLNKQGKQMRHKNYGA